MASNLPAEIMGSQSEAGDAHKVLRQLRLSAP